MSTDNETFGYHLFLMPTGKLAHELAGYIERFASEYDGPSFEPHVTLLAEIPDDEVSAVIERTKTLAASVPSFDVRLADLAGQEPTFFRSLYILVENTKALADARTMAVRSFDMEQGEYRPHLSLFYGNLSKDVKQRMIKSIALPRGESFHADRLYLYHTPGAVRTWRKVGEYRLGGEFDSK